MANLDGYDIALYAFYGVLFISAVPCYLWEILARTPWTTLPARITLLGAKVFQFPPRVADFVWRLSRHLVSHISRQTASDREAGRDDDDGQKMADAEGSGPFPKVRWWVTWAPGVLWLFSIVFALLRLRKNPLDFEMFPPGNFSSGWNENTTKVNSDIGGIGIRIGLYIPVALAFFTLAFGLWHNEDSGAKEIGSAQLLSLFYLNFNAVKAAAAGFRDLTFPDTVIACMCIDFTAAGLHMTSSGKETLASRWFVALSGINQVVAIVVIGAMLAQIRHNFPWQPCTHIVWWGRISSCDGPSGSTWMYFATRSIILAHGLWLDLCQSGEFHALEKDWAELAPDDQFNDKEKTSFEVDDYQYARLRATVFSKWIEWLPSIVISCTSLEVLSSRIKSDTRIQNNSITEWGQSAALVLAIAGAMHWLFVIIRVLKELLEPDNRFKRHVNHPRYSDAWPSRQLGLKDNLLSAAKRGDLANVRRALRHEADPNAVENETHLTALLYAVRRDDHSLVAELMSIKHNANPERPETQTAISLAAERGSHRVLQVLIKRFLLKQRTNPFASCTLYWTNYQGHPVTVNLHIVPRRPQSFKKIADRCDEAASTLRISTPIPAILVNVVMVPDMDLIDVARFPVRAIFKIFLLNRAGSAATNGYQFTRTYDNLEGQLHQESPEQQPSMELAKVFACAFADAQKTLDLADEGGDTALSQAVKLRRERDACALIRCGSQVLLKDGTRETVLYLAAEREELSVIQAIFETTPKTHEFLLTLLGLPDDSYPWLVSNGIISAKSLWPDEDGRQVFLLAFATRSSLFGALIIEGDCWPEFEFADSPDTSSQNIIPTLRGMSDENRRDRCIEIIERDHGGDRLVGVHHRCAIGSDAPLPPPPPDWIASTPSNASSTASELLPPDPDTP